MRQVSMDAGCRFLEARTLRTSELGSKRSFKRTNSGKQHAALNDIRWLDGGGEKFE